MAPKIAIIGGGSAYAPGLLKAFLQKPNIFSGAEIVLMDIAQQELEIVSRLTQKMARSVDVDIKIRATTNQKEAIEGADYVLSTFRQGGFEARHLDESIPLLYNVIGQETIGAGGFFFAMRTLPIIHSILHDIQTTAPSATLINYTNPTQIVAEAVTHFSEVPCVSICDQTKADQEIILHALGLPQAEVFLESIGVNHATWSTHFTINDEEGIKVMRHHKEKVLKREDIDNRVKRQFRLADEYGRLPNSYLQYYYYREETLAEAHAHKLTRAQKIMEILPSYYRHFTEQMQLDEPELTHVRGGSVFGDMAVEVISGLITKDGSIHILNVENNTALPDFPPERIVEVPARLAADGVRPLVQDHLPTEVVGLLQMLGSYQWLAAQSIWSGGRKSLDHALASNPLIVSLDLAHKLIDHMLPLLKPYIPDSFYRRWI